jgi:uncharacterized protein
MPSGMILIDTGPLVALFDHHEEHYEACCQEARALPGRLYTCLPVITEAAYLLNRCDSRLVRMLFDAVADGVYKLLPLDQDDFSQINGLMRKYQDLALDFADAALMHIADRDDIDTVFTLDRRDFHVYQTSKGRSLTIIP